MHHHEEAHILFPRLASKEKKLYSLTGTKGQFLNWSVIFCSNIGLIFSNCVLSIFTFALVFEGFYVFLQSKETFGFKRMI